MNALELFIIACLTMMLTACGSGSSLTSPSTNLVPQDNTKTLVSIQINPGNTTTYLGIKQPFTATGTYSDGSSADLTTAVYWSSSNISIAYFGNVSGLAIPAGIGVATINATDQATILSSTATLTVNAAIIESLIVKPANPIIFPGDTESFTAIGIFSDGSTQDITTSVTWSSDNIDVATIKESGVVTAESKGQAIIKAAFSDSIAATTTLYVKDSIHFLGESKFAQTGIGGSVSSALDPSDSTYYVAYINRLDNQVYYAQYFNNQWVTAKISNESAPDAKYNGIVSMAITPTIQTGYGHIWVAYEAINDHIVLANNDGYSYTGLTGSSPSIAYDPSKSRVCVAYRDRPSQQVLLKCVNLEKEQFTVDDYSPGLGILGKDKGNITNNIHLIFENSAGTPYIAFDDGGNSHHTRVVTYKVRPYVTTWYNACGNTVWFAKNHLASTNTSSETAIALNAGGSLLTVAYIQNTTGKLYIATCKTSDNGDNHWQRNDQYLSNQSGISIAIDPKTNYLYISSKDGGKLALRACKDSNLGACSYFGDISAAQSPYMATTAYATSLSLDANGLPAIAYLDINYFISMVVSITTNF